MSHHPHLYVGFVLTSTKKKRGFPEIRINLLGIPDTNLSGRRTRTARRVRRSIPIEPVEANKVINLQGVGRGQHKHGGEN